MARLAALRVGLRCWAPRARHWLWTGLGPTGPAPSRVPSLRLRSFALVLAANRSPSPPKRLRKPAYRRRRPGAAFPLGELRYRDSDLSSGVRTGLSILARSRPSARSQGTARHPRSRRCRANTVARRSGASDWEMGGVQWRPNNSPVCRRHHRGTPRRGNTEGADLAGDRGKVGLTEFYPTRTVAIPVLSVSLPSRPAALDISQRESNAKEPLARA